MIGHKLFNSKTLNTKSLSSFQKRFLSQAQKEKRIHLFDKELERQKALITRVQKINVKFQGLPKPVEMVMNKNISTPYNCAQHMQQMHMDRSALALVNDTLWDIHTPLKEDCTLDFLHFTYEKYLEELNQVYWRSCSFVLGAVLSEAFRPELNLKLHSWPETDVTSGSFVYDATLDFPNWKAKKEEKVTITRHMGRLVNQSLPLHMLEVKNATALKMFEGDEHKHKQLTSLHKDDEFVRLYRVGDHIDISEGPMIANTNLIGQTIITAVHPLETDFGRVYRFQGVSLPSQIYLNAFAFNLLRERAMKLNPAGQIEDPDKIKEPEKMQDVCK